MIERGISEMVAQQGKTSPMGRGVWREAGALVGGGGAKGVGKGREQERRYRSRRAAAESSEDQGNPIIPSQRWGKGNTNLSQLYLILASQRSCQGGASSPILHRKQVQFRTFPRRQSWCKAELGFKLCLTTLFPLCQELAPAP